jgi:hypothetical protein
VLGAIVGVCSVINVLRNFVLFDPLRPLHLRPLHL